MSLRILITGSNGQLAKSFMAIESDYPQCIFIYKSRSELDITNPNQVAEVILEVKPDYCINTAAYTAVDKAEEEVNLAFSINKGGVQNLCDALLDVKGRLVHYSTDYVYGGESSLPIDEESKTSPQGVYAKSKLEGDYIALGHDTPSLLLRTSWVYSPFGHNFVKTMLRLAETRKELRVVNDQIGSPTYAHDLAKATLDIILNIENQEVDPDFFNGVYHCSNEGECTWADFASSIFKHSNKNVVVHGIPTTEYPTPAKRPAYSVLDKSKLYNRFGISMPEWEDSLLKCLQELNK